jgi:hypothetical protein
MFVCQTGCKTACQETETIMMRILLSLLWMTVAPMSIAAQEAITLQSTDGISIFGEVYLSEQGKQGPVILLFHQGGSMPHPQRVKGGTEQLWDRVLDFLLEQSSQE